MRHQLDRLICVLLLATVGCDRRQNAGTTQPSSATRPATIGSLLYGQLRFTSGSLVQWAEATREFEREGLKFSSSSFPAGPDVLTALRAIGGNQVVAGTVAITPIANSIIGGDRPVIIGSIFRSDRQAQLMTFAGTGVTENASTLKGKRIGRTRNTIADLYLANLLAQSGLTINDVSLVNGRPPEIKALLLRGDLDCAVSWDPFLVQTAREYRTGVTGRKYPDRGEFRVIVDPKLYVSHVVIASTREHIEHKRSELLALLRSLRRSSVRFAEERTAAQMEIERWLQVEPGDLQDVFDHSEFKLTLKPKELADALRSELESIKKTEPNAIIPGSLEPFIDTSLMRQVDPMLIVE